MANLLAPVAMSFVGKILTGGGYTIDANHVYMGADKLCTIDAETHAKALDYFREDPQTARIGELLEWIADDAGLVYDEHEKAYITLDMQQHAMHDAAHEAEHIAQERTYGAW